MAYGVSLRCCDCGKMLDDWSDRGEHAKREHPGVHVMYNVVIDDDYMEKARKLNAIHERRTE